MISTVICDLDGVLIDAKPSHFKALNDALPEQYRISDEEHAIQYDGLTTRQKLHKLTALKGLNSDRHDNIVAAKKQNFEAYLATLKPNFRQQQIFMDLVSLGVDIYVGSNAIAHTVRTALANIGVSRYVRGIKSNEDVSRPKPNPEIYQRIMVDAGCSPDECLIIEDSPVGLEAAYRSGAHVLRVDSPDDLCLEAIVAAMSNARKREVVWADPTMTVVIPMAGSGRRFAEAGYQTHKPLIPVRGQPMIRWAVDALKVRANLIFVVGSHNVELTKFLRYVYPGCTVVLANGVTQGAACTTLLAANYINNRRPLLIANSDQWVDYDAPSFFYSARDADASMLVFPATDDKWSYAAVENGFVTCVAEKKVISPHATAGVYYWRRGEDYVKYANQMIGKGIRVNNEFYVCPVFNEAIADGKKVRIFPVKKMLGMGTPEDLERNLVHLPRQR